VLWVVIFFFLDKFGNKTEDNLRIKVVDKTENKHNLERVVNKLKLRVRPGLRWKLGGR